VFVSRDQVALAGPVDAGVSTLFMYVSKAQRPSMYGESQQQGRAGLTASIEKHLKCVTRASVIDTPQEQNSAIVVPQQRSGIT